MPFHLHLVSDSTGATLNGVVRATLAQFEGAIPVEHLWNLVRSRRDITKVITAVQENPGPVLFTLVDDELAGLLQQGCRALGVPAIAVLQPVISGLSDWLGQRSKAEPGLQHRLNEAYFRRMDAMDFALHHDDGQRTDRGLEQADVILVGVSRTSKTPTCVYLANRGIKAANIPYVPGVPIEDKKLSYVAPLYVGLTESPERLIEIRKNRLRSLNERRETSYLDPEKVTEEVREARRFFAKRNWPVIDVTRRSVEETAAEILALLARRQEEKAGA